MNNLLIDVTHCPACGAMATPEPSLSCVDYLVSKEVFYVSTCNLCGHMYTNPRPNKLNISNYYDSGDYISHHDSSKNIKDHVYQQVKRLMMKRKMRHVKSYVNPGHVFLDIGCGTGAFLSALKDAGYTTQGVEPNAQARQLALGKGLRVYDSLDSIPETNALFNGISLWHVFEHMHDIQANMKWFYKRLASHGHLFIAVPIRDSFDARYYKAYWAAYDLPRHLHHFSRHALVRLAEKNGFVPVGRYRLPFDSFYVAMLSETYMKSLPRWLAYFRALAIGLMSNLMASVGNRPASSELFVFKKV